MEVAIRALPGAASIALRGRAIERLPQRMPPGEPDIMVGPELSWAGVSVCEMDMRWPGGDARHEITCKDAVLWVVREQVGGQYEHRSDPEEPPRSGRPIPHIMSLAPPGMELWGCARSIRYVRSLRLTFDLERAGLALGDRRLGPAFATPRLMFASEPVWQVASLLLAEYRKRTGIDDLYGESIATALCVELLRLGDTGIHSVTRGGLAPWQMRRVAQYMEEHLSDAIQLGDFARLVGMSRSHFSQAFRATTGIPPHRWHLNLRIRRAQELLLDASDSLADIALQTGFSDQSHFTKSFQRQVGTSPGAWRRYRRS